MGATMLSDMDEGTFVVGGIALTALIFIICCLGFDVTHIIPDAMESGFGMLSEVFWTLVSLSFAAIINIGTLTVRAALGIAGIVTRIFRFLRDSFSVPWYVQRVQQLEALLASKRK